MSIEVARVQTGITPEQFMSRFQAGRVLVDWLTQCQTEMETLDAQLSEVARLNPAASGLDSLDVYFPEEAVQPAFDYYQRVFKSRFAANKVEQQTAELDRAVKGLPVTITRTHIDRSTSPIVKLERNYATPRTFDWLPAWKRPDKATGRVIAVNIADNMLRVTPANLTPGKFFVFETSVVDNAGQPVIDIDFQRLD